MYIYAVIIIHNGRFRFLPSMCRLSTGKSCGLDGTYVEHLLHCSQSVFSKVLESILLSRISGLLETCHNQFGFEQSLGTDTCPGHL